MQGNAGNSLLANAARVLRQNFGRGPIDEHVLATYGALRKGLFALAALFPFLLVGLGWAMGVEVQHSLSAYYFAFPDAGPCITFPLRTLFTGGLCAIAVGLYLYKGFTAQENILLNAAAVCGVGVAFVPKGIDEEVAKACTILEPLREAEGWWPYLHFGSAALMFVCLSIVAWHCACATLSYLPAQHQDKEAGFRRRYKIIAIAMVSVLVATVVLEQLVQWSHAILAGEVLGIWVFAWYWFEKTRELELSHAEQRAVHGEEPSEAGGNTGGPPAVAGDLLVRS